MIGKKLLTVLGSVGLVLALVALALGGCVKPVEEAKPINIGYPCSFTGPAGMEFTLTSELVKGMADDLNAAGGLEGRPIKLFIADDGNDPAKAVGNVKRFVELNNCVAIIVSGTSTINLALKGWGEENHVAVICGNALSDKLVDTEGKAWWFNATYHNSLGIEAQLLRVKNLGYNKVGFEASTLAYGQDALAVTKELCPKYGLDFVGSVSCEPKSKDLTIQAKTLRDTGVEAVLQAEYTAEMGVWARALKDIGWHPYMNGPATQLQDALAIYPVELFEDFECMMPIDPTKPGCIKAWDKYEEYTGKRLEAVYLVPVWDAFQLLMEAIRLSGNPDDPESIRDGFYKIKDFPLAAGRKGALGSYEIGRNKSLRVEDMVIAVVKSGKLVPVD